MQRLACFSIYVWLSACFYHSTAQDNNYMRTWNAKSPFFASAGNYTQIPVSDALQVTNYVDGLGRPLQQVIKEGSLNTHSQDLRDWVIPFVYDGFGRESQKYLGYPSVQSSADGELKQDPIQEQTDFLNTKYPENGFTYSSLEFESSPFGRITKTMAPGQSWVGSSRGVTVGYFLGTADDHVVHFKTLPPNDNLAFSDISYSGEYQPGMLNKKITTDEQGKQVIEFQTLDGLTVLKKVQHTSNNDDGNGTDHSGWLCTYYIYDDFGRLICVIQPRGVELLQSLGWDISQQPVIYDEQCFRYKYDARNRMVQKKVPGADPVYMVYDVRDRLVLSQDGKQRLKSQWLYTKYDDLNRVIQTGLYQSAMTRYDHELAGWDETVYPANTGNNELVLTKTFYDNYKWLANEGFSMSEQYYDNSWDYLFLTDPTQWPYPVLNDHQNFICTGLITGTGVRSEATGNLIFTVNRFDQKSRIIQAKAFANVLSGQDVFTTQYSWNGKILFTVHNQKTEPGGEITVLKKFTYDPLDRLVKSEQKIAKENIKNGDLPNDYTPVSQIAYNEFGQVMQKAIPDIEDGAVTGDLETENYDYNIRGWSLGMNREYFNSGDHYFGYELGYDKTGSDVTDNEFSAGQYNGNIAGMVWKSKNKEISRQYDFTYDPLNRLTGAQYSQHDPDACSSPYTPDFSVSDLSYDANGNILTMKQKGLANGGTIVIDDLHYQYTKNAIANISNQLSAVDDNAANNVNLGDFRDNSSTNDNEYQYDANGNLISDPNKRIQLIKYNYLNLPVRIEFSNQNSGIIEYKYDAAGTKQQKVVTEIDGGTTYTSTTYYLGELVYEKREGYPDADGTTKLLFISNEEGRTAYDAVNQELHYEYMMRDHLGNVRMLLNAEEQPLQSYPNCDFEDDHATERDLYYVNGEDNLDTPPPGFTTSGGTGAKCQVIKNNEMAIGVGKLLKVMATDEVGVKLDYYIPTDAVDNTGSNPMQNLIESIISILNNTSYTGPMHGAGTDVGGSFEHDVTLGSLLQPQGVSNPSPNTVKAYLNILFFDEQFNFICAESQYQQLSVMGSAQTVILLGSSMIKSPANGYVYIYVSNESRNPVYIDNFQVVHRPGRIVEETHYYPFGLVMSGISSRAAGGLENKKKWNAGSELESKEFSDGSGVELYSTFYRSLDPQLGRFWQLDPKPNESESPYASMGNNPISNVDPKGDYFFGLFGSTRGQRKSARSIAEETGGDVKNITSKNVSVKFTFKAGEGSLNYGVAETKFSKNGAPTILGKGVKEIYDGVKNGWGRINPQSNKFERIQASGRVEMVDDPISMLGPAFIRGLIAKVTTSIASVASESVVTEANTSLSITRLSREGELFFRYESSNTAFSRVTSTGGVTPGTYAAPLSDGLVPIESRAATYNLPDPDILRTNVSVLTPPKGTVIIGPKPVAGGTGNEVIFPFGF